eukprot:scaffold1511_cov170-Amphora_coffeaeformis.AAC.9
MAFGNQNDKSALVIGGNGGVGMQLLFALVDKNYKITATYHNPADKDKMVAGQPLQLDLTTVSTGELQKIVCQYSVVFFCAGSGGKDVWQVDRDGAIKVANAMSSCTPSQRPYLVLLSSLGCDQADRIPESLREYGRAKYEADNEIFALQQNGLHFTIVRPGTLTDDESLGRVIVQEALNQLKSDSLLRTHEELSISREDVAAVMLQASETFGNHGSSRVIEVIGGQANTDKAKGIRDSLQVLVN